MASITYTAPLNTQKAWQNQGVVSVSGPSGTMPEGSVATKVSLSVYCGATTYNKSQECSFVLTDTWGNSIEIAEDVSWGSVNRVTVDIGDTPDRQLDWNNLSSIDVDGDDDYLNLRGEGTITIEYITPSLGQPGKPTITQNNDGTFTISWGAASYSGGQGSINYEVWEHNNGYPIYNAGTNRTATLKINQYASYNFAYEYGVRATYTGLETFAEKTKITFYYPTISTPVLTISAATGTECSISWTAATLTRTTGTVTYYIYVNNSQVASTTNRTYAFAADTVKSWGDKAVSIKVIAKGTSLGNSDAGSTLTSGDSNIVSFTYKAPYKTIAYYTSNGWVNCLVYYYTSEGWKLCDPYYYTSSGWQSCSTT